MTTRKQIRGSCGRRHLRVMWRVSLLTLMTVVQIRIRAIVYLNFVPSITSNANNTLPFPTSSFLCKCVQSTPQSMQVHVMAGACTNNKYLSSSCLDNNPSIYINCNMSYKTKHSCGTVRPLKSRSNDITNLSFNAMIKLSS